MKNKNIELLVVIIAISIGQTLIAGYFIIVSIFNKKHQEDPVIFVTARLMVALPCSLLLTYVTEKELFIDISFKELIICSIMGLINNVVGPLVGVITVYLSDSAFAVIINQLLPAITVILALIMKEEHLNQLKNIGSLQIVGLVLCTGFAMGISASKMIGKGSSYSYTIIVAVLIGIACNFALGFRDILCRKRYFCNESSTFYKKPFKFAFISLAAAFILFMPFSIIYLVVRMDSIHPRKEIIYSVFYSAICNTTIAFGILNWAIQKTSASFCSCFLPIQVISGLILSSSILGENLSVIGYICAGGIVLGLLCIVISRYYLQKFKNRSLKQPITINTISNKVLNN